MNITPERPHEESTHGGGGDDGGCLSYYGHDDDHAGGGGTLSYNLHDDDDHEGGALQLLSPAPITLEDHTVTPGENTAGLWARRAQVVDYAIVSGSRTRAGAYVAWNCLIETFEGAQFTVRKRYSEFFLLHEQLKSTFPRSVKYLPELPPKSVISKFRPKFLESRRQGLSYFLSCILLNPQFAGSPLVKDFLLHS